ncbi:60S ribosomal protein L28, putative [Plasmodium vinckei]|uniref:60S ribosomal protein L28, putative n=1 Tax=Plasmodium vinckei TaxID=5860 RepID=A0A6V7SZL7_PLAVN|nr:60S ribosomal protein L28, putative [Plasmodium vinckei]
MANISGALIWELTKNNNCFLKRNITGKKEKILCDPYNLRCKNTKNSSGLVNENAVNLRLNKGKVVLCVKSTTKKNVRNRQLRAKNAKKAESLIEEHTKNINTHKKTLLKKYKRLSKTYRINTKSNK